MAAWPEWATVSLVILFTYFGDFGAALMGRGSQHCIDMPGQSLISKMTNNQVSGRPPSNEKQLILR